MLMLLTCALWIAAVGADLPADAAGPDQTVLGIADTHFTINGEPTFLLGISYYGGLGASARFIEQDLADLQQFGFNWLRVWATWGAFQEDVSAVDVQGRAREPFFARLQWLLAECDRRGFVVDVTLARGRVSSETGAGGRLPDFAAHRQAVETLVTSLSSHRNWYLDLANERDVRDDRYVGADELKQLRDLVRQRDPARLVTASCGGHDLSQDDVREALLEVGLDFLAVHRPRDADSPAQTEARTRECLALMRDAGRVVPLHHQEPFRRGYGAWDPTANDFLTDLRGAYAGGAAGWCLHNGQQRTTANGQPRRSFDLRSRRLFDQLDADELQVVRRARELLAQELRR
jgi:hypothetical protein